MVSIEEHKTFYACARFLVNEDICKYFQQLYVVDIDININNDLTSYINMLKKHTFALPVSSDLSFISPWRRYMAGNVFFGKDFDIGFLKNIQHYIIAGLQRENSWMLDQNALAYALDNKNIDYLNLSTIKRPISQPKINKLLERNHNEFKKTWG